MELHNKSDYPLFTLYIQDWSKKCRYILIQGFREYVGVQFIEVQKEAQVMPMNPKK
eukprot:c24134_g2_i1 orf=210-377(-)